MNPIQLQEKRQLSVLKERIFYMANHIKFYSINSQIGTIFYFVAQSLALMSIFSVSPVFDSSNSTIQFINQINSAFFFYSSSVYQGFDTSLAVSHFVSLFLLLIFCAIAYFTNTINYRKRIGISKADLNKVQITEILVFFLVSLNIPLGSFFSYYLIEIIETGMEYLLLIPILNLIVLFSLVYIIEECSIQTNLKNYSALSRLYNKKESLQAISKMMVRMVVTSFNNLPTNVIILSVIILLTFDLYELRITIFSKKYLSSTTENIYSFKNICVVVIEVLMIICLLAQMPLVVGNFFLATFSTSILAFVALLKFKHYNKRQLTFKGLDFVKTEDDAKIYMLESIGMLEKKKNHQEIFTLGMITIHMESCQVTTCFCKRYLQQPNKELAKNEDFLKRFVLKHLQEVINKFQKSFLLISILFNYKLSIMSSFSKIYELLKHYIQQNNENINSFSQQYMLYQMEVIIEQQIHNNNLITPTKKVDAQKIFCEEALKQELNNILNNINDKLLEKYKLLSQQICNLNLIENICDQISDCIRQVEQRWTAFKKDDSYNLKIYELFLIYFEYIIYSRKQVSEVKNTILRKTQSLHHLKGIHKENLERYIYTNRACVIEVTASKEKLGIITNASSFCYDLFKVTKDRLINKAIHDIMPQYIVQAHRCWSRNWIDQQTLNGKILGIVNTYYIDANGNCFSASLHMKVVSVGFRLKFYVMMIRDNSNDYVLLNDDLQIQGYGYRLQNEHVFNKSALKTHINKYCEINLKEEMGSANSIKRRILFINQNNPMVEVLTCSNTTTTNIVNLESQLPNITETFMHECEVLIQRNTIHNFNFYTIKFIDIRKLKKQNSYQFISKTMRLSLNVKDSISNRSKEYVEKLPDKDQLESSKNKNILCQDYQEDIKFQVRNNMSSIAESSVGDGNIVFSKLIQEIKQKTVDYKKSHDSKITLVTCIIILLSLTVIAVSWIQSYVFSRGMQSYSEIIRANSFLGQNTILLELNYNKQLAVQLYCFDNTAYDMNRCNFLLHSSSIMLDAYYTSLLSNMRDYLKSKTYLTHIHLYSARQKQINLKVDNLTTTITARQFVEYFYYSLQQIVNRISPNYQGLNSVVNQSYELVFTNWLSMKQANKQTIAFYQEAGAKQLSYLQTLIVVLSGAYLLFVVLLMVGLKLYSVYKQNKKLQVMKLYGFLNHSTCNYLKQMNQSTRNCLKTSYSEILVNVEGRGLSDSKQKSQTKYKKDKRINYLILISLALLSTINITIIFQTTSLFQPATFILDTVENLIKAEGDVFESYLQIKTYYLNYNFTLTPTQLFQKLVGMVNSSDINFAKYAKQAISAFSQLDPSFQTNFKEYLTDNICQVTQQFFIHEYQIAKCFSGMNFDVMQEGIVSAMGFYQRKTYNALLELTLGNVTDTSSYFKSRIYEDMDDYIFYMYLVCYLIQNSMIQGINNATEATSLSIMILVAIEIALIVFLLILWVGRLSNEKKKMSNLYGAVLQLPQILFKENKVIIRILKENLNLKY